jgi:phosphopentomutase
LEKTLKRAIVIVLDGCGAGSTPDHALFHDLPSDNTLLNVWNKVGEIEAPNLIGAGFFAGSGAAQSPGLSGFHVECGRLLPKSMGKDSVTGHWEMMGIITHTAFPTYPDGFPADLVTEFEQRIDRKVIGNKAASGTAIIAEMGEEHIRTGFPILYTSADSVFQIACHESVVPIEQLYDFCRIAREICVEPNNVQRVIARPFDGTANPGFRRTEKRKDFPVVPVHNLVDDIGQVFGIGVVPELFDSRGFRPVKRTQSNVEHAKVLTTALGSDSRFIFANFEDTDMLFGHRNDPLGFAKCLEDFDAVLGSVINQMTNDDLLILTADHGNDPTSLSTDHAREYSPLSAITRGGGVTSVEGKSLSYIGELVANWLGVEFNAH